MKRFVLIIAAMAIMGTSYAQLGQVGKSVAKGLRGLGNGRQAIKNAENNIKRQIPIAPMLPVSPIQDTCLNRLMREHEKTMRKHEELMSMLAQPMPVLSIPQPIFSDTSKAYVDHVLNRFLSYARIESQSVYVEDPDSFPMTEGQMQIARYIYDELKGICKGTKVDIKKSPDFCIYVKVPSNIKKKVLSLLYMAHMDVTPEANGKGIDPQVHYDYRGGDINLGHGIVLSPDRPEDRHLKDLIGKTIITSDGSTLLGADCKTGCAIFWLHKSNKW